MSLNRSIRRNIKKDKSLEPYFLNLSEWIYRTEDLTEDEESPVEYNNAMLLLLNKLNEEYNIESKADLNELIEELIVYYRDKYTIEEQFEKNRKWRLKNNIDSDWEEELDEQISHCRKCNSPRMSLTFSELPSQAQMAFEKEKEDADYFLYCSVCNEYSMIYKSDAL